MTGTMVESAVRPLRCSSGIRDYLYRAESAKWIIVKSVECRFEAQTDSKLVTVDDRSPEGGLVLVEVSHSNLESREAE